LSKSDYTFVYSEKPPFKNLDNNDSRRYMNMNMFYNKDEI